MTWHEEHMDAFLHHDTSTDLWCIRTFIGDVTVHLMLRDAVLNPSASPLTAKDYLADWIAEQKESEQNQSQS